MIFLRQQLIMIILVDTIFICIICVENMYYSFPTDISVGSCAESFCCRLSAVGLQCMQSIATGQTSQRSCLSNRWSKYTPIQIACFFSSHSQIWRVHYSKFRMLRRRREPHQWYCYLRIIFFSCKCVSCYQLKDLYVSEFTILLCAVFSDRCCFRFYLTFFVFDVGIVVNNHIDSRLCKLREWVTREKRMKNDYAFRVTLELKSFLINSISRGSLYEIMVVWSNTEND
jgi:hypothetical protein